ncbi:MAG: pyrrolidone-carboxylate peptidase [Gemmatales bacterium]|nr:MAG: pyrrolidone-carboxylate peptidase [Gemmatales bacterium]
MRLLLTSFEPFAGLTQNSSLEIGKAIAGTRFDAVNLDWLVLPVVKDVCFEITWKRVKSFKPDVVLALGQADGAAAMQIEQLAVNVNDFEIPDNGGNQPRHECIVKNGPAAIFTSFPPKELVCRLAAEGVPVKRSYSAGTYVCNHLLYRLLHGSRRTRSGLRVGFIHLPLLPGQRGRRPRPKGAPMAETMVAGLRRCIELYANSSGELTRRK